MTDIPRDTKSTLYFDLLSSAKAGSTGSADVDVTAEEETAGEEAACPRETEGIVSGRPRAAPQVNAAATRRVSMMKGTGVARRISWEAASGIGRTPGIGTLRVKSFL
jgi:hypothetical protein